MSDCHLGYFYFCGPHLQKQGNQAKKVLTATVHFQDWTQTCDQLDTWVAAPLFLHHPDPRRPVVQSGAKPPLPALLCGLFPDLHRGAACLFHQWRLPVVQQSVIEQGHWVEEGLKPDLPQHHGLFLQVLQQEENGRFVVFPKKKTNLWRHHDENRTFLMIPLVRYQLDHPICFLRELLNHLCD